MSITLPVAFRFPNISVLLPPVILPTMILSTVGWLMFTVSLLLISKEFQSPTALSVP